MFFTRFFIKDLACLRPRPFSPEFGTEVFHGTSNEYEKRYRGCIKTSTRWDVVRGIHAATAINYKYLH